MITRDFGSPFNVVDFTREVNLIPNTWGTINNLNIFEVNPVAEQVVTFQEIQQGFGLVLDRVRGDRQNQSQDYTRKLHSVPVPHFPLGDQIVPKDIQGKSAYTNLSEAETLDAVRMRKMERIRKSHAATLEKARAQLLTSGTVYAPNGTVALNWFTEMGVTQTVVDFLLGTPATAVMAKVEAGIAAIQDNAGVNEISGIVALCSPVFFAKLIVHATIVNAYQYFASTQNILRDRAGAADGTGLHRTFYFMGCNFIEMRDSYAGSLLIPTGDAVMIPTGTDFFRTYFAPAERFGLVNTLGEQVYFFENANQYGTAIDIDTESNFLNGMMKPALCVRLTSSN
jgi:hypothetical protein